ncbi:MAG: oxidoreductase [Chitinophagaceae bacterium]|nr:oxidoreductase [Chitinophagaceae bacterium]
MRWIILYYLFSSFMASGQKVEITGKREGVSFRGLSVVSGKVLWVSGSKGTIGRSRDGGRSFEWMIVPGYENREFRDVEAFDAQTAVIMAVAEPAVILRTENGGKAWKVVYFNDTPGMFLDALEFWNDESGIVIGDPVKGRFFVARTFDGGNNWRPLAFDKLPPADSAEACFAASGTNVRALKRDEACFISGGSKSRFFWKNKPVVLPIVTGKETQGANSIAVWYRNRKQPLIVVAGGDFANPASVDRNCAVSKDGGVTWSNPATAPTGYRSCVEFINPRKLITCGLNGVDISDDEGATWKNISREGFHVCRKAKNGKAVYLAGNEKIGKLVRE